MAITLQETFRVRAPVDAVWRFMMDPYQVAGCMPGADLEEVVEGGAFLGSIVVKVGAITTSYKGRIQFTNVDEAGYAIAMVAEGRETGGGTAKGTLSSRLSRLQDGETEVAIEASVEITGRIAQMGRGMIEGVSRQLFQQFVTCATSRLEASPEEAAAMAAAKPQPIRIVPVVLKVLWTAIARFVRRLFRRGAA